MNAATPRLEVFREGLQECEARVALEQALLDKALAAKLGDDLAQQALALLVERQRTFFRTVARLQVGPSLEFDDPHAWDWAIVCGHLWYVQSGWQEQGEKLYSLAGEVARKLEGK